jgi:hypothetical protein
MVRAYAALAVVGAVLPYTIFLPWAARHGFDWGRFFTAPFATPPAALFSADLLFSAGVFAIFVGVEGLRLRMRHLWAPFAAIIVFGLCCALPLFLAHRERALS